MLCPAACPQDPGARLSPSALISLTPTAHIPRFMRGIQRSYPIPTCLGQAEACRELRGMSEFVGLLREMMASCKIRSFPCNSNLTILHKLCKK